MVEKISRSEQKRLFKQVEELASELSELTDKDLKKLPAQEEIKENIRACRTVKAGARKRQVKYLAKILRQDELDDIYGFMRARKGSDLKKKQIFHTAERWRDVVINEGMEIHDTCIRQQRIFEPDYGSRMIMALLEEYDGLNELEVRRSVYQYVKSRNKMHYRELFRMVKAAIEQKERS